MAGIVAANGKEGPESPDFPKENHIDGAAPNAQVLAMKVFSNSGKAGAADINIIRAIEDSVKLGANVINMSLGAPNGMANASDGVERALKKAYEAGVMTVIAAGNEGQNFSPDNSTMDLIGQLDDGTVGSPGANNPGLTVASIDNTQQALPLVFSKTDGQGEEDFFYQLASGKPDGKEHELVDGGYGSADEVKGKNYSGKFVLVQRGKDITFTEKYKNVFAQGAEGIVVYNHKDGGDEFLGMAGVEKFKQFGVFIYHTAGQKLAEKMKEGKKVTVRFTNDQKLVDFGYANLRPSEFTGWGTTPNLDFAPNIAGIGGAVYSLHNDGSYANNSGTSMASPNVAGLSALLYQAYAKRFEGLAGPQLIERVSTALQNTASIPKDENGLPHPTRRVGAGLANVDAAISTNVFATVDGKPNVALRQINESRSFVVTLENMGKEAVTYTVPEQVVINETNETGKKTLPIKSNETLTANTREVSVPAGGKATVTFTLNPDTSRNHFIEGWAMLTSTDKSKAPDLHVPYLGFVGDWNAEKIVKEPGQELMPGQSMGTYTKLVSTLFGKTIPIDAVAQKFDDEDGKFWLSPNDDKRFDVMTPALMMMRNASDIKYEIYTADGKLVKKLGHEKGVRRATWNDVVAKKFANVQHVASSYEFDGLIWDPQKADFTKVPEGRYIYRVSSRLSDKFDWQVTDLPFGVDYTAPKIVFGDVIKGEKPGDPSVINLTIVEELSGIPYGLTAVTDDGTVLRYPSIKRNGPGAPGVKGVNYTVTVPEGAKFVSFGTQDRGLNESSATKVLAGTTLVVGNETQINTKPLGPTSKLVKDGKLAVAGVASPDITKVTINGKDAALADSQFTGEVKLAEGKNTVEVKGYDASGKEIAAVTLTPYYDTAAPKLAVTNSVNGKVALRDSGEAVLIGQVSDNNRDAKLTVKSGSKYAKVEADGTFSITVKPKATDSSVTLVASDGANTTTVAVPIADREQPPVTFEGPKWLNAQCAPTLASCVVPLGPDQVKDGTFTLVGKVNTPVGSMTVTPEARVENGKYVGGDPIVVQPRQDGLIAIPFTGITTGFNDFAYTITDPAGTVRMSGAMTLLVDVKAPTITFEDPTLISGTLFTNKDEVVFKGTASDDGWGYTFKINDSVVEELFNFTGHGPESNERHFAQAVAVKDGDTILLKFVDSMGNELTGMIPVVVDKIAPNVAVSAAEGDVIRDGSPVTTRATDDHLASLAVNVVGPDGYTFDKTVDNTLTATPVSVQDVLAGDTPAQDGDESEEGEANATEQAEGTADQAAPAPSEKENPEKDAPAQDAMGTQAQIDKTKFDLPFATKDLKAGQYTLTATGTDYAGNVTTKAVTFTVDALPVISGDDEINLTLEPTQLGDLDQVLSHYTVTDDSGAKLSVTKGTILHEGKNTVVLVATQADGFEVTRTVTVNVTLKALTPDGDSSGLVTDAPGDVTSDNASDNASGDAGSNGSTGTGTDGASGKASAGTDGASGKADAGADSASGKADADTGIAGKGKVQKHTGTSVDFHKGKVTTKDMVLSLGNHSSTKPTTTVTPNPTSKGSLAYTGASAAGLGAVAIALMVAGVFATVRKERQ
ncbi:S8 family serine peptidase [Arcanobacterium canis]|uniref:S8 family serine peptidase n=1 Tax=Arcanobacterium canis TaxID=999183 RepID=A0ABY8FZ77_9ACTO|nr:S8 family serine peptidase [Arcanobacterium canis]WFM83522.1 S8 family serine peptidase [Arcanobacterium canis]